MVFGNIWRCLSYRSARSDRCLVPVLFQYAQAARLSLQNVRVSWSHIPHGTSISGRRRGRISRSIASRRIPSSPLAALHLTKIRERESVHVYVASRQRYRRPARLLTWFVACLVYLVVTRQTAVPSPNPSETSVKDDGEISTNESLKDIFFPSISSFQVFTRLMPSHLAVPRSRQPSLLAQVRSGYTWDFGSHQRSARKRRSPAEPFDRYSSISENPGPARKVAVPSRVLPCLDALTSNVSFTTHLPTNAFRSRSISGEARTL